MSEAGLGALLIALMFLLFAMGLEISISMGLVGVLGLLYLKGWTVGLGVVGSIAWSNATSFSFIAVPLFIFMSGILLHSGIGKGLFTAVARWVGFLPGGPKKDTGVCPTGGAGLGIPSGVSKEVSRSMRLLSLGAWTAVVIETDLASSQLQLTASLDHPGETGRLMSRSPRLPGGR